MICSLKSTKDRKQNTKDKLDSMSKLNVFKKNESKDKINNELLGNSNKEKIEKSGKEESKRRNKKGKGNNNKKI